MQIDRELITKAKEKLGDKNASIIISELGITDFNERDMKCCCPFHQEDHASFVYNPKAFNFHCFGSCSRSYDIIDIFMFKGMTYAQACRRLFELAEIPYSFGELGVKTKRQYHYPKEVICTTKDRVYSYFRKRKISQKTIDYADVREDENGNIAFNYYDTNDVLTMVKYRPARKIRKGENKCWCQQGADTTPLLFNMNRVNATMPLLICEGESDCLSAIEAGFTNAVSVPLGSGNFHWMEENWTWLSQFDSIIICSDNDEAGLKMQKECIYRLGSWRTKVVAIPEFYDLPNGNRVAVNDLNEVLYWFGPNKVLDCILSAKDSPVPGVVDFSDIQDIDLDALDGIPTGLPELDKYLMKLFYGTLNIVTGINGCVSADTEYFNGKGWIPISQYQPGDFVLQYEAGKGSLVRPIAYHKYPCSQFWQLKSKYGVDQVVSDEHNIVYMDGNGVLVKIDAASLVKKHNKSKMGFRGRFLTTFRYSGDGLVGIPDNKIKLICAIVCSGHIALQRNGVILCTIETDDKPKRDRIKYLLSRSNVQYKCTSMDLHNPYHSIFEFEISSYEYTFGPEWYRCDKRQIKFIAKEILFWVKKPLKKNIYFSTADKPTADFVQFVFSTSGCRSSIATSFGHSNITYTVTITNQAFTTLASTKEKTNIARISSTDGFKYCFTVPSGMLILRHNGRINITGNSGKSSFLNQVICQCLERGENAYLFSGELPNFQAKNWLNFIFAGQRNVKQYQYNDSVYYKVTPEAKKAISDFYRGRLYIRQDGESNKKADLMQSIEDSVRKYGTKLVILDNMTAIDLESNDTNKYDKQAEFIMDLISFAVKFNVVVVLVVHPHKIDTMRRLTKMDVQGISAIIDLAHRIISLYRVQDREKKGQRKTRGDGWNVEPVKADVIIDILKDRLTGYESRSVEVFYDRPSRRFFMSLEDLDFQYAWDKKKYITSLPFPPKQLEDEEDEDEVLGERL